MAARKLQQEVDKCFKKVSEGIAEFDSIYDKIEQSTNASQKEKLEDNLKREIKKLQRLRDQIKTWAASSDIKDKGPLLENRKLIETQMERFKAVEKAMKTKAYSKEGLSAATKLDPKERAKAEVCEFLGNMVEELDRQIEQMEAEGESIQATMKKGKLAPAKADRMAEIEKLTERHKWHQGKLELIRRSLENGGVDVEDVKGLEETIKYYVTDGMNSDYMEDEEMYDDLNLADDEDNFGMNNENDRVSSQDAQSVQEEAPEVERSSSIPAGKAKAAATTEPPATAARRPSMQHKSPLPALATLHQTPLNNVSNGNTTTVMKPAALPPRPPGEGLKYASAAAAAAASDKNNIGIAPLPPPPVEFPNPAAPPPVPSSTVPKNMSAFSSPALLPAQPVQASQKASAPPAPIIPNPTPVSVPPSSHNTPTTGKSPSQGSARPSVSKSGSVPQTPALEKVEQPKQPGSHLSKQHQDLLALITEADGGIRSNGTPNGVANGHGGLDGAADQLPPALRELTESFEASRKRITGSAAPSQAVQRMLAASQASCPEWQDHESSAFKRGGVRYNTPSYYPQEPAPIFKDPRLYSRVETDTLFYIFYYRQNTYQQYLAAKALKDQSWRFHKQYQTWFQRHEEPKNITDEFEQGTYRFFDYESTWCVKRKSSGQSSRRSYWESDGPVYEPRRH